MKIKLTDVFLHPNAITVNLTELTNEIATEKFGY